MAELLEPARLGSPILGALLPAGVFFVAFFLTYMLIRRFMKGI